MIGAAIDSLVGVFSPASHIKRLQARAVLRQYQAGESSRLNAQAKPKNQSADAEMQGPFGADSARAWARKLVRDNAYAWGVVDTIVCSVIGNGIKVQSAVETPDGEDVEDVNERRDKVWADWCEVCELTGQYCFDELQAVAMREVVEAGEVLVHRVTVPTRYRGIMRPVPLALELIEADRLATDRDTYTISRTNGRRIVRGVEIDELGAPVAYWIYPEHPNAQYSFRREPVRIEARNVCHIFRRDRVGQSRGMTWFAPVVSWLRDLGVYQDNELTASAVAACPALVVKTNTPFSFPTPPSTESGTSSTVDANGNPYGYMEPGMILKLANNEDAMGFNPSRPSSSAESWISLMLRGIAVGTGLSYETVARDYSKTSYSSSRTSTMEDRRRFRRWQKHLVIGGLVAPVWDAFCDAAALADVAGFPTMSDLLADRRKSSAAEFMPPTWEWVDLTAEQQSSERSILACQSTYADEIGARGASWRSVFYQRAKEEALKKKLGLVAPDQPEAPGLPAPGQESAAVADASGEMAGLSTLQFKRNRKAIESILAELSAGTTTEAKARVFLSGIGMKQASIDALIADAMDGKVESLPADDSCECERSVERNCGTGEGGFQSGNSCGGEGGGGGGSLASPASHSVSLPKSPKRLNVDQADAALKQMGYARKGQPEFSGGKMYWTVEDSKGNVAQMEAREVTALIYANSSDTATKSIKVPKKREAGDVFDIERDFAGIQSRAAE